jgi:hypothetical protein
MLHQGTVVRKTVPRSEAVRLQDDLALEILDLIERAPIAIAPKLEIRDPLGPRLFCCHRGGSSRQIGVSACVLGPQNDERNPFDQPKYLDYAIRCALSHLVRPFELSESRMR